MLEMIDNCWASLPAHIWHHAWAFIWQLSWAFVVFIWPHAWAFVAFINMTLFLCICAFYMTSSLSKYLYKIMFVQLWHLYGIMLVQLCHLYDIMLVQLWHLYMTLGLCSYSIYMTSCLCSCDIYMTSCLCSYGIYMTSCLCSYDIYMTSCLFSYGIYMTSCLCIYDIYMTSCLWVLQGVERHQRGVKPPTPDKSSTVYILIWLSLFSITTWAILQTFKLIIEKNYDSRYPSFVYFSIARRVSCFIGFVIYARCLWCLSFLCSWNIQNRSGFIDVENSQVLFIPPLVLVRTMEQFVRQASVIEFRMCTADAAAEATTTTKISLLSLLLLLLLVPCCCCCCFWCQSCSSLCCISAAIGSKALWLNLVSIIFTQSFSRIFGEIYLFCVEFLFRQCGQSILSLESLPKMHHNARHMSLCQGTIHQCCQCNPTDFFRRITQQFLSIVLPIPDLYFC